jgi:hypothetical protein
MNVGMTAANNSFGVAEFEGQTFLASDIAKFSQVRSAFVTSACASSALCQCGLF